MRDRAALYLKVLKEEPLAEKFVKDGRFYDKVFDLKLPREPHAINITVLINFSSCSDSTISLAALESKLVNYISNSDSNVKPFEITSVPRISREQARQEAIRK